MARLLVLLIALQICMAPATRAQQPDPALPGITVTGRADTTLPPDQVTLSLGVLAQGRTAADAVDRMGRDAAALFDTLDAAGIPPSNVGTSTLDLRAVRDPNAVPEPGRAPRITGFEAETRVTVTVGALDTLGPLLDAVVRAGANRIDGIRFGLADPETVQAGLRAEAVRDAMARARGYAAAAGVTLGAVLEIRDTPGGGAVPMGRMMAAEAGVPIAPGSLRLSAEVVMRFAIGD
jgi:uncharacterized protein YggE